MGKRLMLVSALLGIVLLILVVGLLFLGDQTAPSAGHHYFVELHSGMNVTQK